MPLTFKSPQPRPLQLRSRGSSFTLLLDEIPSTTLFELAQRFQQGRRDTGSESAAIPADFARLILEAVCAAASCWEGVNGEDGAPLEFDPAKLRSILDSDVALIPQLISFVAELFLEARAEDQRLEGEEKN